MQVNPNDWMAKYRTGGQPQPVPQPAPQPIPSMPIRQVQQQAAEQGIVLNQNQDARAAQALANDAERLRIAREKADADKAARNANAGVDTTASQDQAAGHAIMLNNAVKQIDQATLKDKNAAAPGWLETAVGVVTDNQDAKGLVQSGQRQVVAGQYKTALQSAIWLMTGAASPEAQTKEIMDSITPRVTDKPEALRAKRQTLQAYIEQARARAGPAKLKEYEAIDQIYGPQVQSALDRIYGPEGGQGSRFKANTPITDAQGNIIHTIGDIASPEALQESTGKRSTNFVDEAQAEHAAWIKQNAAWATPEDYHAYRQSLATRYPIAVGREGIQPMTPEKRAEYEEYLKFHREHPNADVGKVRYEEQLEGLEKVRAAADHFLSPGIALGASAGNALSGGIIPELLPEEKQNNFQAYKDKNPKMSLAGDLAGSVGAVSALEKLLIKGGVKAFGKEMPVKAATAANAAYGGTRGATGAPEGEGLEQALGYGGLAAIGGLVGTAVVGGTRPFTAANKLDDMDTLGTYPEITVMQAVGKGKGEEALQNLPIIRGAREASAAGWNNANINRALKPLGVKLPKDVEAGTQANAEMNRLLNEGYNQISPKIVGALDDIFKTNVTAIQQSIMASPLKRSLWGEIDAIRRNLPNGRYDGNSFKDADRSLRTLADDWAKVEAGSGTTQPSVYHEMAKVAEKVRQQLRAQVARNTPEVAGRLKALDKAWAHSLRIEDATRRALAHGGDGVYSPANYMTSIRVLDKSKNKGQSARGKALDQKYAQAAQNLLGTKSVPETVNLRDALLAAYVAIQNPVKTGLLAPASAALYTPGIKELVKAILTKKRPKAIENAPTAAFTGQGLRIFQEDKNTHKHKRD
jgi:hypothetical protein